ncbi:serine hydrolase domain-containing protein [Paenibacillus crassostreae]|uniref:Beta-lactamase-related domain-containing protein n=1 Tax=Paenibacillus crassostreae TaxID=1763538 RepID=A0A167GDB9_9BACL|nr:serine hydrolase domain-containing protein [Paenibacillus crassostreae]AOZ92695.1 hypothetical protein LPB68_11005 [Paenibacillus crassostreae]OAB77466.1 hypothetical protein PNBC_02000 [Paenibacillus crassostreae]
MRWIKPILLIMMVFILTIPFTSEAMAEGIQDSVISEERLDQAVSYFNEQMERNDIVGGVLGITHQDKLIRSQGFGKLDLEREQMPNENTVYSIASVTKSFTATAIYQLQHEGLLDIDQTVSTYIPWFQFKQKELTDQITLRHLLTHSAGGIGSFQTDGLVFEDNKARDSLEDFVRLFDQIEITQEPGQSGSYCNGCYSILGLVIEQVSGLSYYDYIQQKILDPLQMKDTVFGHHLNSITDSQLAKEYTWFLANKVHINRSFEAFGSAQDPEGGLYSTIEDLSKFHSAQLGFAEYSLLAPDSIEESRIGYVTTEMNNASYTASGFERKELHQNATFYKTGDGVGSATAILFIPEHDLGITLFLGEFHPEIQQQMIEGITSVMLGHEPESNLAPFTLGKLLGIISITLILLGTFFLVFLIRRLWRKGLYAKNLVRSILSLIGYGACAAPFWFLFLTVRPTSIGFYGYPYDLAIGMIMFVGAFSLWFMYYVMVIFLKKYKRKLNQGVATLTSKL